MPAPSRIANRLGDGRIAELIRLKPGTVQVEEDASGEPRYLIAQAGGGQRAYHWSDVLHIENVGGVSPVRNAREAIGIAVAMNGHAARLFASGARPSGVLQSKSGLKEATLKRLKESWRAYHSGENSGSTAILEDGIEFKPLTFSSVDAQFEQLRQFQVVEICRSLGVPPTLVFDFGRATWSNAAEMAQAYLTFTLLPRLRLWAGAVSRLLSEAEQEQFVPEFVVDGIVMADIEKRFAAYSSAISSRIMNPNEVRSRENMAPYAAGDEYLNPNTTAGAPDGQQEAAA